MWDEQKLQPHQVQGSPEWYQFRQAHLGASDIPVIMGKSDFSKPHDLFLQKTNPWVAQPETWPMIRGKMLEPVIIARFEQLHNCRLESDVLEWREWPIISASLDGWWDLERAVIECKAPSLSKHTEALCGLVPETYIDQVQSQILVKECEKAYYVSFHDGEPESHCYAEVLVYRDEKRIKEIVERCRIFWDIVLSGVWRDDF